MTRVIVLAASTALALGLFGPPTASAEETVLSNVSLAVFTTYDNETGRPQGQRFHLKYRVCGSGERHWVRMSVYRSPYGKDSPVTAKVFRTFSEPMEEWCESWTYGSNVTSAFKRGQLKVCVRAGTTTSWASRLVCVRARTR